MILSGKVKAKGPFLCFEDVQQLQLSPLAGHFVVYIFF